LYGEHLATEEKITYPQAKALMDAADLEQAGQEMARRRGVR
jgi:hypothetical protein